MRISAAIAALLALAACGKGAGRDAADAVLRVGSQRGGTKAMMLASGALRGAAYTVEWSEFPAAQHLLEAIGSGAVDVGLVGDAPFIFAYQSGSPIKAVGAETIGRYPDGALSILVPASSPIRSIADLKGKKVATTRGSVGHFLVLRSLSAAKLPPDYLTITFLSPGDAKAAFSSGAIDAWATWTPYTSAAVREGARIVVDAAGLFQSYGFDVANERSIAAHRAIMADFLGREAKALDWVRAHPNSFAAVLSKETGLPLNVARDYSVLNARVAVPIDAGVIARQREVAEEFRRAGNASGDRDLAYAFEPLPATISVQ